MKKNIKPENSSNYYYYEDINVCPICKHNISPKYIYSYLHLDSSMLSLYCECTSCNKPFIVLYSKIEKNAQNKYVCSKIEYSAPTLPQKISFNSHINEISEDFVNIYNEAHIAEELKLNNICGIGYRKSIEFLIKDYCIHLYPDSINEIKSMFLAQVIDKFIDSMKLKNLAKVSVWIGNDETHYVRKFADKDINDLKKFIDATVAYITYELISEEATSIVESK